MADDEQVRFTLRIPKGLFDRINEAADASNRSANSEILSVLSEKYGGSAGDDLQKLSDYRVILMSELQAMIASETTLRSLFLNAEEEGSDFDRLKNAYFSIQKEVEDAKSRLNAIDVAIHTLRSSDQGAHSGRSPRRKRSLDQS